MIFDKKLLATAVVSAFVLTGCGGSEQQAQAESSAIDRSQPVTLAISSAEKYAALSAVEFTASDAVSEKLNFDIGFGSGATRHPDDEPGVFYTISDRGPNIKCSDAGKVIAEPFSALCMDGEALDKSGKIFPVPSFTPRIDKWTIARTAEGAALEHLETLELKNSAGKAVTGLTNDLSSNTENGYDNQGRKLAFDNEGLDTEAIARLSNGRFWLSEEYGPSLVLVDADGTILERVMPEGVTFNGEQPGYRISSALPGVLAHRQLNRGIESLAVDPGGENLYFSMQSPLAHPNKDAYKGSRLVRLFKFALNNDGSLGEQKGEWVYEMDRPQTFGDLRDPQNIKGDNKTKFSKVKISELAAVGEDDLVILERISKTTKLYRVSLGTGANIMNQPVSTGTVDVEETESKKTLEQLYNPERVGAQPVVKQLAYNSLTDIGGDQLPQKVEGLALMGDGDILLINDNDFGINRSPVTVTLLPVEKQLTAEKAKPARVGLSMVGRYQSGVLGKSAAEIVAFHAGSKRIMVVNARSGMVDLLDATTLSSHAVEDAQAQRGLNNLNKISSLDVASDVAKAVGQPMGAANSVAVNGDLVAVAIEAGIKQGIGYIAFYSLKTDGQTTFLKAVKSGALPDMVTFSPDGAFAIAANEGEPSGDYSHDPEGSITLVPVKDGQPADTATILDFKAFNEGESRHDELKDVRVFGGAFGQPRSSVAQDLEPEYITVSADSRTAFVVLQENNAMATVDLTEGRINSIVGLGAKDHSIAGNAFDASDKDKKVAGAGTLHANGKSRINLQAWDNVKGFYQPDSISSYTYNGKTMVLMANEGDAREYIAGALNEDLETKAACEADGSNWDGRLNQCFDGLTPAQCEAKGFLNKENEECFSYVEEFRVVDLLSDGDYGDFTFVPASVQKYLDGFDGFDTNKGALGRLKITTTAGFDESSKFTTLYKYGGESFSIRDDQGRLVFDSGNDLARLAAGFDGKHFNASNDRSGDHKKNDRSGAKSVEPEALTTGKIGDRTYAFVGLERFGGIAIYDVTSPYGVQLVDYVNNRDHTKNPKKDTTAGDSGPEGMQFVAAEQSPTGKPLLIVGSEVSGTTSVYEVR